MPKLTHALLIELLEFDQSTGVFIWRSTRGGSAKAGSPAGTTNLAGYMQVRVNGRIYLGHRLAWFYVHGVWPSDSVDHINGVRLDNRLSNLRDVGRRINNENRRTASRFSKTGLLGASPVASGNFVAHISVRGRVKCLGTYSTAEEAHKVYIEAKRQLHEGNTL